MVAKKVRIDPAWNKQAIFGECLVGSVHALQGCASKGVPNDGGSSLTSARTNVGPVLGAQDDIYWQSISKH